MLAAFIYVLLPAHLLNNFKMKKTWLLITSVITSILLALSQYYKAGREKAKLTVERNKRKNAEKQARTLEEANEAVQNAEKIGRKDIERELKKARNGDTTYFDR